LIKETLRAQHIPEEQLGRWRKGHPFKIKLAMRLRSQTTVPLGWIAERLKNGNARPFGSPPVSPGAQRTRKAALKPTGSDK
jgi:hypothetical protein